MQPDDAASIKVGGIVLCGGRSRRMGRCKAWLRFSDEYLLQRVVRIVSTAVGPVVVVGAPDQALPKLPDGIEIARDRIVGQGPLAGIDAGMSALSGRCEAALVASVDHPLIQPALIARLIELLDQHQAIVPTDENGAFPLLAVYRLSAHATLTDMLAGADRRAREFARLCGAHEIHTGDLLAVDPHLDSFRNANDPTALADISAEPHSPESTRPDTPWSAS